MQTAKTSGRAAAVGNSGTVELEEVDVEAEVVAEDVELVVEVELVVVLDSEGLRAA